MPPVAASREWDFTLLPFTRIVRSLLDVVAPKIVMEVGADRGDFTRELLDWTAARGASVVAVDPEPAAELLELAESHPELELVRGASPGVIAEMSPAEAIILDGDHNYYTLSEELRVIAERPSGSHLPLVILHDLGWPHVRRDTYYAPERVPAEHRQPLLRGATLAPGKPGTARDGLRFEWAAAREGGPCNGTLTAVEDFLGDREGLSLAIVPAFFGLGVLWPQDAPWATRAAETVGPWNASPMLDRLEEIRLDQIVDRTRMNRQEALLRGMLSSRAFALAERVARIRWGGSTPVSRARIRRTLDE